MESYVRRILSSRVYDVAIETPLDPMPRLSARLGADVRLKREDLQPAFSFKLRGAYNKMVRLTPAELAAGVICASAGNHGQGVALSAQALGIRAVIVMPVTTPAIKVDAVRARGAETVLFGDNFDAALDHARALETSEGLTFIHPYDDPDVIAGQGTVGMEILRQHSGPIDAIFVPIGGGGLAAGIAAYTKFLRPEVEVIGVEPADAASMAAAIAANKRVTLEKIGTFADGVAVRQVGSETFRLCRELLDDVILVDTDSICAAVKDIFEDTRVISEPAGALSLAGLKAYAARRPPPAGALVAINSGANMNFDRLSHVAERAEIGEQREALFAVTIPERPGSFRRFIHALGPRSVTEFNYRAHSTEEAHIFLGIQISGGAEERRELADQLRRADYEVLDLSENEMAKLHVRHMVGGPAVDRTDELLLRIQFPERRGALLAFLDGLSNRWNISLFHYRNHGAEYGRALVGIQVPGADRGELWRLLDTLGYPYADETDNPAHPLFL